MCLKLMYIRVIIFSKYMHSYNYKNTLIHFLYIFSNYQCKNYAHICIRLNMLSILFTEHVSVIKLPVIPYPHFYINNIFKICTALVYIRSLHLTHNSNPHFTLLHNVHYIHFSPQYVVLSAFVF